MTASLAGDECIPAKPGAPADEECVRPVILRGELVEPVPSVHDARERFTKSLERLPRTAFALCSPTEHHYRVEQSKELQALAERVRSDRRWQDKTVFVDVDTQIDFVYPAGALYAPGAETIVPALVRRTGTRRRAAYR